MISDHDVRSYCPATDPHTADGKGIVWAISVTSHIIELPEMNGYQATKKIKNITAINQIPILAVTSYAMAGDREKALAIGCAGYIEKPFNPETFVAEIEKYL